MWRPRSVYSPSAANLGPADYRALADWYMVVDRSREHEESLIKQFTVMEGISHASFQQKNYLGVYHILHSFFTQPEAVYRG